MTRREIRAAGDGAVLGAVPLLDVEDVPGVVARARAALPDW